MPEFERMVLVKVCAHKTQIWEKCTREELKYIFAPFPGSKCHERRLVWTGIHNGYRCWIQMCGEYAHAIVQQPVMPKKALIKKIREIIRNAWDGENFYEQGVITDLLDLFHQ